MNFEWKVTTRIIVLFTRPDGAVVKSSANGLVFKLWQSIRLWCDGAPNELFIVPFIVPSSLTGTISP